MILDDLIVFVSALFGALVGIPILLINLIAAMAEAIVSLVGGSLELGRITNPLRKKKDRDQESSESSSKIVAGLFVIIVVAGLLERS